MLCLGRPLHNLSLQLPSPISSFFLFFLCAPFFVCLFFPIYFFLYFFPFPCFLLFLSLFSSFPHHRRLRLSLDLSRSWRWAAAAAGSAAGGIRGSRRAARSAAASPGAAPAACRSCAAACRIGARGGDGGLHWRLHNGRWHRRLPSGRQGRQRAGRGRIGPRQCRIGRASCRERVCSTV